MHCFIYFAAVIGATFPGNANSKVAFIPNSLAFS